MIGGIKEMKMFETQWREGEILRYRTIPVHHVRCEENWWHDFKEDNYHMFMWQVEVNHTGPGPFIIGRYWCYYIDPFDFLNHTKYRILYPTEKIMQRTLMQELGIN